jgi:hypothetical protein
MVYVKVKKKKKKELLKQIMVCQLYDKHALELLSLVVFLHSFFFPGFDTPPHPVLFQEIVAIHRFLSPPTLTTAQSNRVCNALALLQVT